MKALYLQAATGVGADIGGKITTPGFVSRAALRYRGPASPAVATDLPIAYPPCRSAHASLPTVAAMSFRICRPRLLFGLLALAQLALGANAAHALSQAYTVEVRPVLNDLDVKIEHVAKSTMLVLNLTNNSPTRVRCDIQFDASPQTPRRSTRHIDPGQTGTSSLRAHRRWFSVRVDVVCVPSPR